VTSTNLSTKLKRMAEVFGLRSAPASASPIGVPASRIAPLDSSLLSVVIVLLLCGVVFVYSASIPLADHPENAKYAAHHYLLRHLISIAVALVVGIALFALVPLEWWNRAAPWVFVATLFLLILVLMPFIGKEAKGARRWIPIGPMSLQPTELMKFAAILYAANYIARKQKLKEMFVKGFLPVGVALGIAGALVLAQKDLGGATVVVVCAMLVLFYGGINIRIFLAMVVVLAISIALSIAFYSYRFERILAFVNPFDARYERGIAWQLTNSLIAFARGGIWGEGLGQSVEKLFYLPDAHTDFIFAVVGEELGFVGVLAFILVYWWIVWRAFAIGRQAIILERAFAGLVALGIGSWLGVQTVINMGVALGALPTKGLTLPFLSFGGSAVLASVISVAVLLRVDYENRQIMSGRRL
jgi:cell division protein FtsW